MRKLNFNSLLFLNRFECVRRHKVSALCLAFAIAFRLFRYEKFQWRCDAQMAKSEIYVRAKSNICSDAWQFTQIYRRARVAPFEYIFVVGIGKKPGWTRQKKKLFNSYLTFTWKQNEWQRHSYRRKRRNLCMVIRSKRARKKNAKNLIWNFIKRSEWVISRIPGAFHVNFVWQYLTLVAQQISMECNVCTRTKQTPNNSTQSIAQYWRPSDTNLYPALLMTGPIPVRWSANVGQRATELMDHNGVIDTTPATASHSPSVKHTIHRQQFAQVHLLTQFLANL